MPTPTQISASRRLIRVPLKVVGVAGAFQGTSHHFDSLPFRGFRLLFRTSCNAIDNFCLFVQTPWAHIDIAGPAWCSKSGSGTGYAVRTLVELALCADE